MPAMAPRSLRGHGTTHTAVDGSASLSGPTATTTVAASSPRSEPSGATPPVTVTRTRASGRSWDASTSAIATRSASSSNGTRRSRPSAERRRRSRCRRVAKGRPSTALSVSNTPSPTVSPWSKIETVASVGVDQRPVHPDRSVVVHHRRS